MTKTRKLCYNINMKSAKEINRELYLEKLRLAKDIDFIKVITGARRCGKSTLLGQFQRELLVDGVNRANIISLNLEKIEFSFIKSFEDLYYYVKDRIIDGDTNYIFIDEVQEIEEFERAVDSLFTLDNVDLYITGSNSKMLSSEIATLLTGRYIEIQMLPFSFAEYVQLRQEKPDDIFEQFLEFGGFPAVANQGSIELMDFSIQSLYETSIIKDINQRMPHLEIQKLERVADFIFNNIGSTISANNIANTLTSNKEPIADKSISSYLSILSDSYILYPAERYDIKGKKLLKNLKKYYLVDQGLRRATRSRIPKADLGHGLENVVFLELRRRFSRVWVGKANENEVDFTVSDNDGNVQYIQVSYYTMDENTMKRELAPLQKIRDNQPKILLSLDVKRPKNYDGIRHINAIDWLMGVTVL
ncbi:ATPase [Actinomycetota bacterium]|nr:ATPase [Actinomycetota bacterium]